jgi:hypothetical protein
MKGVRIMRYDCCPVCDDYRIEYTGVYHAGAYEVICHGCGWHGAYRWEPFIAPYKCTKIGLSLRAYIRQYKQFNLSTEDIEYIKGLQS